MQNNQILPVNVKSVSVLPEERLASQAQNQRHLLHGFLGGLAGLAMDGLLHPIDTVRTRMKVNVGESVGLMSQIKSIYKNEGLFSYFKGYSCTLPGAFAANASYFFIYEKIKDFITTKNVIPEHIAPFVAAFAGSVVANSIYLPFITVRTRMQLGSSRYDYNHIADGFAKIIKREGFRKLYLGAPVFLTQTALDMSLTFGFYEMFYNAWEPLFSSKKDFNLPLSIAASASAASLSAIIVNPLDVLVTRMQTMGTSLQGSCSIFQMVKRIHKYEGFGGFMKGVSCTIPHYALGALILLPTYEALKESYQMDLAF